MNPLFLDRNIFILMLSEAIVWGVMLLTLPVVASLLRRWDFSDYTSGQFRLERRAYLVTTVAVFVFVLKLLLFPYFIFTIDKLSAVVPGAMCAAGVISFDPSGMHLLYLKVTVVFVLVWWLVIHRFDLAEGTYPWALLKFRLFVLLLLLTGWELWMEYRFFDALDIHAVLNCCATLYGLLEGMNPLPFGLEKWWMVTLFYLLWLLILFSYLADRPLRYAAGMVLFGIIAYYSVLYVFGTYIYELPGHHCPFCMFQKEYYYVGYLIWGLLGGGLFLGISGVVSEFMLGVNASGLKRFSSWLLSLFVFVCTLYVLSYVVRNGTLLQEEISSEMMMPM
jgi:hypothetical protein